MKRKVINKICLAYLAIAFVTMFPLTCGYIMDGGIIREWAVRMEELSGCLRNGSLLLFPTDGAVAVGRGQLPLIDSNLWYLLPALLMGFSGSLTAGWECYMIFMQLGTLLTAYLLFDRLFEKAGSRYPVFFGVLLYMTCPYRIYVCYDLADMAQVAVWALLPLYIWACAGIAGRRKMTVCLCAGSLALAGIGYASLLSMLVVAGLTMLSAVCMRKFFLLIPAGVGCVLAVPGLLRLYYYLFREAYVHLGIPVNTIMDKGYDPGEFFSLFVYRDGHPGLGTGLLFCLLYGLWLLMVKKEKKDGEGAGPRSEAVLCFTGLAGVLTLISLRFFPWEFVQRLGRWALKLVSLFETPAVFFGLAQAALCVPGAWAMERADAGEDKEEGFILAILAAAACLGTCIYQCNMLTYTRILMKM